MRMVVIIPQKNVKDLRDIPKEVKQALTISPVKWIDEVYAHALVQWPVESKALMADDAAKIVRSEPQAMDETVSH